MVVPDCEVGGWACGAGDCGYWEFGVDGGAVGVVC